MKQLKWRRFIDKVRFSCIMVTKVQLLCDEIKKRLDITYEETIKLLYNSKLYNTLEDEEIKMWYYSNEYLLEFFFEELETGDFNICEGNNEDG